jgi:hypothetical protein
MASSTITFDPDSGVPYGANLTIYGGNRFSLKHLILRVLQIVLSILQVTLEQESYPNLLVLEYQLAVVIILPLQLV